MKKDEQIIRANIKDSIEVKNKLFALIPDIRKMCSVIRKAVSGDRTIIIFGNGGSAADSQHFAAELVCKFNKIRKPLRAVALTTNTSNLTSIANDFDYSHVFSRQLEAIARKGDVAIAISTSGKSPNVIRAVKSAAGMGLKTISLTGGNGGKLKRLTSLNISVPSECTARIQEAHILILHAVCELIESDL